MSNNTACICRVRASPSSPDDHRPTGEQHALPHDEPQHRARGRAWRNANADLLPPLCHGKQGNSPNTEGPSRVRSRRRCQSSRSEASAAPRRPVICSSVVISEIGTLRSDTQIASRTPASPGRVAARSYDNAHSAPHILKRVDEHHQLDHRSIRAAACSPRR
jgi:hypothetical protein